MGKKSGGRVRVKQVGGNKAAQMANPLEALAIPPEEQIYFPPKPDTNISHVWPVSQTFTMNYKQFSVVYPTNLDKNKTVQRGRRIAADDAVPNPSVADIAEALASMGIRHVVQPYKGYSRDAESQWDNLGRVLVDMETPTNQPMEFDADDMPDINDEPKSWNKKALLRQLGRTIPNLPGRQHRLQEAERAKAQAKEEAAQKAAAAQKASASHTATAGGHSRKKKGKKKR